MFTIKNIILVLVCACVFLLITLGCLQERSVYDNWYKRHNWKAEDYFDDPKVILLCQAMETEDPSAKNEPRKKVEEEYDQCIAWLEEHGVSFDKPAEKPKVFREVEEFRVNDKLLKWREKWQKHDE